MPETGFYWDVRISGLVSGALCTIACVDGSLASVVERNLLDIKSITDTRFALLAIGSRLVTLGEFNTKHSRYLIISLPRFRWTNPHLEVRIGDYEDVTKVLGCSGKVKQINGLKSGKYLNRVSIGISIMNLNPPFLPLILAKFASLCRREVEV